MNDDQATDRNCSSGCGCSGGSLARRDFIKVLGAGAGAMLGGTLPVMAGPFEDQNEYLAMIPADKKLDPAWVRSLFERGEKETYSDPRALRHIGMPVGGFFAGTVYLSGDGRLWLWDVFNRDQEGIDPRPVAYKGNNVRMRDGANFVEPAVPRSPFKVGFALRIGDKERSIDLDGFSDVFFDGRYPIGRVTYRDDDSAAQVWLEAFSPFIPLDVDDSSLPATVMSYTVRNRSDRPIEVELAGLLENPVCLETGASLIGRRTNRVVADESLSAVVCSAEPVEDEPGAQRPDVVFEDFEKDDYTGWTVAGEAFGQGPVRQEDVPDYQGDLGIEGERAVNSHATAPGDDVRRRDDGVGTLTSRPFLIERRFIHLLVGGGAHEGRTCVNLLIDGEVVGSVTGRNHNLMQPAAFNVARHEGKQARIRINDSQRGGWGNIGVDQIVFSDRPPNYGKLSEQRDFGTMTLALLDRNDADRASAIQDKDRPAAAGGLGDSLTGHVARTMTLEPGEEQTVDFVVAWHFPNFGGHKDWFRGRKLGHWYASRFDSALDVTRYVSANFERLAGGTRAWVETWYDSTLPYWLLDRTMANTSTLATTTCYRHRDGRYWCWEGVGCCPGTCTHVWHYAQAPGRLFPEMERDQRRRVDFGLAFDDKTGAIHYRAEVHDHHADDGQCGRILGVYREHLMSADDAFLRELWPKVKKAVRFMIDRDADADGILNGAQPNTLDAAWYGRISFTSSLYLAALRAGEAMAREMGDNGFAKQCSDIATAGARSIVQLYNGEYFIQVEDPAHKDKIGVGPGCYIDQVFGQTWAHWIGAGRLFDRDKQLSALRSLWKYNFVPDVGPFREAFPRGRWYAMAGDAGLLMCTWPRGGKNPAFKDHWQYMYFNECMSGFEWQAAAHMIFEGHDQPDLLQSGLAVGRAIHDRYNAALRNPYNEIECSDHYARAMASYGAFQAVCGFHCHGPRGRIAFEPRLAPDGFRSAFVGPSGWGAYHQQRGDRAMQAMLQLRHGKLRLRTVELTPRSAAAIRSVKVKLGKAEVPASLLRRDRHVVIELERDVELVTGETLSISLA